MPYTVMVERGNFVHILNERIAEDGSFSWLRRPLDFQKENPQEKSPGIAIIANTSDIDGEKRLPKGIKG